jgi:hypothetical protein
MAKKDVNGAGESLRAAIVRILSEQPGLEARKIASLLRANGWSGLRRKEVNSALYSGLSSKRFRKDGSATPRWWLGRVAPLQTQSELRPLTVRGDDASTFSTNERRRSTGPAETETGEANGDWRIFELD